MARPISTVGRPNCWNPRTADSSQTPEATTPRRIIPRGARNGRSAPGASFLSSHAAIVGMQMLIR